MYSNICADPYCPNKKKVEELEAKIRSLEEALRKERERYNPPSGTLDAFGQGRDALDM